LSLTFPADRKRAHLIISRPDTHRLQSDALLVADGLSRRGLVDDVIFNEVLPFIMPPVREYSELRNNRHRKQTVIPVVSPPFKWIEMREVPGRLQVVAMGDLLYYITINPGTLESTLYVSNDRGKTVVYQANLPLAARHVSFIFNKPNDVYMFGAYANDGVRWGLWRSTDGLKRFDFVSEPLGHQIIWRHRPLKTCAAAIAPNGDFLYVWDSQLWRSKDSGLTWSTGVETMDEAICEMDSLVSHGMCMYALLDHSEWTQTSLAKSDDNGETWEAFEPLLQMEPDFLLKDHAKNRLICLGRKASYVSEDGLKWMMIDVCWRNGVKKHISGAICRDHFAAGILKSGLLMLSIGLGDADADQSQIVVLSANSI